MTQTKVSFYYYILPLKKGMPYNNKKNNQMGPNQT